ncbi:hypothetical protein ScPMuIL_017625 [Solemya velum]
MYDIVVVGAGMIGSAAGRYASSIPNLKVCLIGPDEVTERNIDDPHDVFGAYYDEGRITRSTDPDRVWSILARRSIDRYREIEKLSGIKFYEERGFLSVGTVGNAYIEQVQQCVTEQGIRCNKDVRKLKEQFPYLDLPRNDKWIFEMSQAGIINPRRLVNAQQKMALKNGCDIVRGIVNKVTRCVDNNGDYVMRIQTDTGEECVAKKVLLAPGAFTASRDLLGTDLVPDVYLKPTNVCLAEITESDAQMLRSMPAVTYFGKGNKGWWDDIASNERGNSGFYMLPPIRYPDGKYYLKLGNCPEFQGNNDIQTAADLKTWYCLKDETVLSKALGRLIQTLIPGVKMKSFKPDRCVIVETPTSRPYLDMLHSQLGLVTGGNGWAAKSSDEIGRLAVGMIMGGIQDEELTADMFTTRYKMRSQSKL